MLDGVQPVFCGGLILAVEKNWKGSNEFLGEGGAIFFLSFIIFFTVRQKLRLGPIFFKFVFHFWAAKNKLEGRNLKQKQKKVRSCLQKKMGGDL